jgi:NADPH-dependent glutamate synthase beta subunit-like oxidoreductase
MTLRLREIPKDPYLGYDAVAVARWGAACLQCVSPAPCTQACHRHADIPRVMRLAGQAACEGLALPRWFQDREAVEAARIADALTDCYS